MAVIAIPISLQSMITIGVNMTDTVMVGKLGETSLSATVLFMLPTILIPQLLMRMYTNDSAVIAQGVQYFKWMVYCYFLQGMTMTCTIVLRSVGQVNFPLFTSRVTVSLICQRNKVENTDFVSGDGCLLPIHIFWSVT